MFLISMRILPRVSPRAKRKMKMMADQEGLKWNLILTVRSGKSIIVMI